MSILNPAELPLNVRNAEQLLTAMKASGLSPTQVAEALHTAIFMLGRGNNLTRNQMNLMFAQETELLERSMVFASDLLKGPTQ